MTKIKSESEKMSIFAYNGTQTTANVIKTQDLTLSQTTNFRLFQTERICRRQFQI